MDEEREYYLLVRKVFDMLAPFYDIVTLPISRVRDRVVNFTNAGNGSKILDVATGTGKQALAFAKKGHEVVGIDISEAMLSVANRKNIYGNVKFETADSVHLRFSDNSFDVSCVSFALHDMPSAIREKALTEMVRVTKENGMIVIVDYALPENRVGRSLIYRIVSLYEGKYYSTFIQFDLGAWLRKTGIAIQEELPVLCGAGEILKGKKMPKDFLPSND